MALIRVESRTQCKKPRPLYKAAPALPNQLAENYFKLAKKRIFNLQKILN